MRDSFVGQTERNRPSLGLRVDVLRFRDFPRGLWRSGSLDSKLDSPGLVETIYSIPLFTSGNAQAQPSLGSSARNHMKAREAERQANGGVTFLRIGAVC